MNKIVTIESILKTTSQSETNKIDLNLNLNLH